MGSSGRGWVSWWCSTSSRRLRGPRPPPRARRTATLPRPKRNRLGSRPVGWSGATSRASRWERPRRRSSTTAIGWHAAVAGAGYVPGLYVGFHCGLDATQLYRALRFSHYWGAYNLNADEMPIVRGLQMKQSLCKPPDAVPGHTFEFQVDTVRADALGGHPTLVARDGLGSRPVGWSGATSRASRWERPRRRSSTTAIGGTRRSPARDTSASSAVK